MIAIKAFGSLTHWGRDKMAAISKRYFHMHIFYENVWVLLKISLKFVAKGPINNIPALFQIMAWRRPGDKSLSETMMVSLPTHICVTRPQCVNKYIWLSAERYVLDKPALALIAGPDIRHQSYIL